jgi:hypothetical protein
MELDVDKIVNAENMMLRMLDDGCYTLDEIFDECKHVLGLSSEDARLDIFDRSD